MGRTHRIKTTFARLGDELGYVPKEDILYVMKAIVVTQRENGRRDERRYSRMKYLIDDWGIDKFRSVVEQYYGKKIEPFKELPEWEFVDYLGWHEQVISSLHHVLHLKKKLGTCTDFHLHSIGIGTTYSTYLLHVTELHLRFFLSF